MGMTYGIRWPVGPDLFMRPTPFLASRRWRSRTTHWAPFCTLTDMGTKYIFEAEIPGAVRENLKLTVQNGQLTLDAWGRGFDVLVDKPCYSRTFYLDSMVDAGHATAEFTTGCKLTAVLDKVGANAQVMGGKKPSVTGEIAIVSPSRQSTSAGKWRSVSTSSLFSALVF